MGLFGKSSKQSWGSPESIGGVKGAVSEDMRGRTQARNRADKAATAAATPPIRPLTKAEFRAAKEAAAAATEQPRRRF